MNLIAKHILTRFAWALKDKAEALAVSRRELDRAGWSIADLLAEIGPSWFVSASDKKTILFRRKAQAA